MEQHVRDTGLDVTFLRPNLFFQGFLAFAGLVAQSSTSYAPIGTSAVSAIDVRDIAAVASAALVEDGHQRATYTLTGPRRSPTARSPTRSARRWGTPSPTPTHHRSSSAPR